MRLRILMVLAVSMVGSLAFAQHCSKADIDPTTGFCTVPDPKLTPGEMDSSLACSTTGRLHSVSDSDKALILVSYGYSQTTKKSSGEFDHWIPEWMGGTDGPKNIWFEPHAGKYGSYAKDKVEASLYRKVCVDHSMSLEDAKALYLKDWKKLLPH